MQIFEIKGYPDYELHYSSSEQLVYSKKSGKYLKNCLTKWGYYRITLCNIYGKKHWSLHRLVWYTFNGEIPKGYEVNHINEIKTDNRIENLNLMTPSQNVNYGTRNQKCSEKLLNNKDLSKAIIGIHKQTYNIIEFPSIREAMRFDKKFDKAHISKCCQHKKRKTVNNYYFFYKEEFDKLIENFNGDIKKIIEYKLSKY